MYCPTLFSNQYQLNEHIQQNHRGSQGWYEDGTPQINDRGKVELKSLEHQLVSMREKMEKQHPISSPISAPRPRETLNIPEGWVKTNNGYLYEHEIFRHHTPINATVGILHATLSNNSIKCILHTYDKDLSEISRLQEKEAILEGRLASFVPSDPAFPQIASELHKVKSEITHLTKTLRPDETHHLIFEFFSNSPPNTEENIKWQSEMMSRTLSEAERLKNNYQHQHESDIK